jgi:hypothetical protein
LDGLKTEEIFAVLRTSDLKIGAMDIAVVVLWRRRQSALPIYAVSTGDCGNKMRGRDTNTAFTKLIKTDWLDFID